MYSSRRVRLILAGTASVLVILLAGAPVRCQRARRLVEAVDLIGYRRLTKEEILSHLKTKPGNPYSEGQVQRDFERLLKLGWFDKLVTRVMIEDGVRGGVVVTFEVRELPLIVGVSFAGLRDIPESKVIDALSREKISLASGTVCDIAEMRRARLVIQRFLVSNGRRYAVVEVFFENVTATSVRVGFVITDEARF